MTNVVMFGPAFAVIVGIVGLLHSAIAPPDIAAGPPWRLEAVDTFGHETEPAIRAHPAWVAWPDARYSAGRRPTTCRGGAG